MSFSCSQEDVLDCISNSFPDSYDYPIMPGTKEWIDLGSREKRLEASMISPETLETMSTGGLFESLLSYPFILDYGAWEEFQVGFEKLKSENMGFAELYSREDLFHIIYDWYESISPKCKDLTYHPLHAPVELELEIIEMFIFQNEFLDKLNHHQIIELFDLIYNKLQLKTELAYLDRGKWISSAILGKIMYREGFKQFIDECNNNEFLLFFINYIPLYRPTTLNPIEIVAKYSSEFYIFPNR